MKRVRERSCPVLESGWVIPVHGFPVQEFVLSIFISRTMCSLSEPSSLVSTGFRAFSLAAPRADVGLNHWRRAWPLAIEGERECAESAVTRVLPPIHPALESETGLDSR